MLLDQKRRSLSLITVLGLGFMRPFPGTWGSLPPVAVAGAMMAAGLGPRHAPAVYILAMLAIAIVFAWACVRDGTAAEARFLGKDPSEVVADEAAGQALVLTLLPSAALGTPVLAAFTLLLAFVAFRVMDIAKPWPVWKLQSLPGGWGILLDDLLAAVYAVVLLHACVAIAR